MRTIKLAVAAMGTARAVYRYDELPVVNPLLQEAPPRMHNGVWWCAAVNFPPFYVIACRV
jgi:hypothetical protein